MCIGGVIRVIIRGCNVLNWDKHSFWSEDKRNDGLSALPRSSDLPKLVKLLRPRSSFNGTMGNCVPCAYNR